MIGDDTDDLINDVLDDFTEDNQDQDDIIAQNDDFTDDINNNDDQIDNIDNDIIDDNGLTIADILGDDWPEIVGEIQLNVQCILGKRMIPISDLLRSGRGAVIELDRGREEPVTLVAEEKVIAEGTVMVENDHFRMRIDRVLTERIYELVSEQ